MDITKEFAKIAELKRNLEEAEAKVVDAQSELSKVLQQFSQKHGSSFEVDGKWFQIRNRINGSYLCQMDVKPGSWLLKNKPL